MLGDVEWPDGSPVAPSPRQVLKRQVERAAEAGFTAMFGSELEFFLLKETYEEAHAKHYRDLTPSVPYILDYHILASTYDEPLHPPDPERDGGRRHSGRDLEGRGRPGQHEINFRYADALTMADNHVIYKNGAKELAHLNGCSITFMAKPTTRGSAARATSIRASGATARARLPARPTSSSSTSPGRSPASRSWRSSSRRRSTRTSAIAAASWAPTTLAWGHDNRTCGFRIVGHGAALRTETRIPGGDVNPYLAFAALIAAGLYGIENGLELPPPLEGNAYESDAERFPHSLREAIAALENGTMAGPGPRRRRRRPLPELRPHRAELFDTVVTCYERERMFERG